MMTLSRMRAKGLSQDERFCRAGEGLVTRILMSYFMSGVPQY